MSRKLLLILVVFIAIYLLVICMENLMKSIEAGGGSNSILQYKKSFQQMSFLLGETRTKAKCEPWPMTVDSLPLGDTLTYVADGITGPSCVGMSRLMRTMFKEGLPNRSYFPVGVNYDDESVNCMDYTPSTFLMMNRINEKDVPFNAIRSCMHNYSVANGGNYPFITLRSQPKTGYRQLDLGSKAGFPKLFEEHAPCADFASDDKKKGLPPCILPRTFRISESEEDCKLFFNHLASSANSTSQKKPYQEWIRKPVFGSGGAGVKKLTDPATELESFSECDLTKKHPNIIVQQYLKPHLILDGRSFHIRTYYIYKYGRGKPNNQETRYNNNEQQQQMDENDPPQAWHIRVGNIHVCSEPYSMIDDEELGSFAMKCNRHAWDTNPRIEGDDWYENHDHFRPFPSFLKETLPSSQYKTLMKRIDEIFVSLSKVITALATKTDSYSLEDEGLWFILGVDLLVDENLRPWLIEVNGCPGSPLYGTNRSVVSRDPYISIYRLIFTHYKRKLVGDSKYDENACGQDVEIGDLVHRVM